MEILFVFAPLMAYALGAWTAFDCIWKSHEKNFDWAWQQGYQFGLKQARESIEQLEQLETLAHDH